MLPIAGTRNPPGFAEPCGGRPCPHGFVDTTVMEPNSRDTLRRAVRRAVHQACWRRLEGDHGRGEAESFREIDHLRAEHPEAHVSDDDIRAWIAEDEGDFDRAILISDLVARRVQRTAEPEAAPAPTPVAAREEVPVRAAREAVVRAPVRTAPSITALLDDMFAQQRSASGAQP